MLRWGAKDRKESPRELWGVSNQTKQLVLAYLSQAEP